MLFFRFLLLTCLINFGAIHLSAQDSRLAAQYYQSGEYEKAASLYKRLYQKSKGNYNYYNRYIESLLAYEAYDEAEASIKQEIKRRPNDMELYVSYGNLYEKKFEPEKADEQFRKAIANLDNNISRISRLGNAFSLLAKYDLAIETFEKGAKLTGGKHQFSNNLANLYQRKGDYKKMIFYYLQGINTYRKRLTSLENIFQRALPEESYNDLQAQLYERIQESPDEPLYTELLQWTFIHRKQYDRALRQARAMDRSLEENGNRVFEIANIAENDKDYSTAMKAYQYIIDEQGPNTTYYLDAKLGLLNAKRKSITKNYDYTTASLQELELEYERFLDEFGKNTETASLIKQLAYLKAYYLDNVDSAITLLEEVKNYGGLKKYEIADTKIELGDLYLIKGDIWEASLLYSQVDKAFKEGRIGELARFKNARLSYFNGDFEWAQEQFDILKSATTKLISNDAIDMSVFITDNMGLDTTDVPLKMYAESELLLFQNKYDDALDKLSEIDTLFPEHSLADDILYSKAQIYEKLKDYEQSKTMFESIIENHVEEIRCDNALFELAELYEGPLANKEEAMKLYKRLFEEFSNSTLATIARKRFRILRGDEVQ
jgi:tetratricopeptide (TPR) repeat protein